MSPHAPPALPAPPAVATLAPVPTLASCRFCGATDHATRRTDQAVEACIAATTGDAGLIDRALDALTQVETDLGRHRLRGGRIPQAYLSQVIGTSDATLSRAKSGARGLPPEHRRRLIAVIQDPAHPPAVPPKRKGALPKSAEDLRDPGLWLSGPATMIDRFKRAADHARMTQTALLGEAMGRFLKLFMRTGKLPPLSTAKQKHGHHRVSWSSIEDTLKAFDDAIGGSAARPHYLQVAVEQLLASKPEPPTHAELKKLEEVFEAQEKRSILAALRQAENKNDLAAEILGMDPRAFLSRLRKYGIGSIQVRATRSDKGTKRGPMKPRRVKP